MNKEDIELTALIRHIEILSVGSDADALLVVKRHIEGRAGHGRKAAGNGIHNISQELAIRIRQHVKELAGGIVNHGFGWGGAGTQRNWRAWDRCERDSGQVDG